MQHSLPHRTHLDSCCRRSRSGSSPCATHSGSGRRCGERRRLVSSPRGSKSCEGDVLVVAVPHLQRVVWCVCNTRQY